MENYFVIYIITIFVIAGLVQMIKPRVKHDWALRVVAAVLCAIASVVAYFGAALPGTWVAIFGYFALAYVSQYFISMEVLKKIAKAVLKKKGIAMEDAK